MVLRKIYLLSLAKFLAVLYAMFGLIEGVLFALISMMGITGSPGSGGESGALALVFGVGAIVIFPVLGAVAGFLGGLIGGLLMNIALSISGGLLLELR